MTTPAPGEVWTRRLRAAATPKARLLCFPPAGGTAMYFLHLAQAIAKPIDVLAVQYPGRQDRRHEPCVTAVPALADGAAAAVGTDLPLALFGHGLGAAVAFETALRLDRAGTPPLALFASGRAAPARHRPGHTHNAPDHVLAADLRALGPGEPRAADCALDPLHTPLRVLRADYRASETYPRTDAKVSCHILSMVGDCDPTTTVDETRQWGSATTNTAELQVFSGGHFYVAFFVSTVANTISERIRALLPDQTA